MAKMHGAPRFLDGARAGSFLNVAWGLPLGSTSSEKHSTLLPPAAAAPATNTEPLITTANSLSIVPQSQQAREPPSSLQGATPPLLPMVEVNFSLDQGEEGESLLQDNHQLQEGKRESKRGKIPGFQVVSAAAEEAGKVGGEERGVGGGEDGERRGVRSGADRQLPVLDQSSIEPLPLTIAAAILSVRTTATPETDGLGGAFEMVWESSSDTSEEVIGSKTSCSNTPSDEEGWDAVRDAYVSAMSSAPPAPSAAAIGNALGHAIANKKREIAELGLKRGRAPSDAPSDSPALDGCAVTTAGTPGVHAAMLDAVPGNNDGETSGDTDDTASDDMSSDDLLVGGSDSEEPSDTCVPGVIVLGPQVRRSRGGKSTRIRAAGVEAAARPKAATRGSSLLASPPPPISPSSPPSPQAAHDQHKRGGGGGKESSALDSDNILSTPPCDTFKILDGPPSGGGDVVAGTHTHSHIHTHTQTHTHTHMLTHTWSQVETEVARGRLYPLAHTLTHTHTPLALLKVALSGCSLHALLYNCQREPTQKSTTSYSTSIIAFMYT